jgi:hypothetical protein
MPKPQVVGAGVVRAEVGVGAESIVEHVIESEARRETGAGASLAKGDLRAHGHVGGQPPFGTRRPPQESHQRPQRERARRGKDGIGLREDGVRVFGKRESTPDLQLWREPVSYLAIEPKRPRPVIIDVGLAQRQSRRQTEVPLVGRAGQGIVGDDLCVGYDWDREEESNGESEGPSKSESEEHGVDEGVAGTIFGA